MKQAILVFLVAFVASVSLPLFSACGDECNCPANPARPEPQKLGNLSVASFDEHGEYANLEVQPEQGNLEVTGDQVIIAYQQDSVEHRVVYKVLGP